MRRRPILIRRHLRVSSPHPPAAPLASPHLHRVALHFWLRGLRHIRDARLVGPLVPQFTPAARALVDRYRHWDRRLTIGPSPGGSLPKAKAALSRLPPRPLGIRLPLSPSALRSSPRRLQLLAQLLILPPQPVDLLVGLLQALAQIFVLLFQFLNPPEGRAGVCTCHSKQR